MTRKIGREIRKARMTVDDMRMYPIESLGSFSSSHREEAHPTVLEWEDAE